MTNEPAPRPIEDTNYYQEGQRSNRQGAVDTFNRTGNVGGVPQRLGNIVTANGVEVDEIPTPIVHNGPKSEFPATTTAGNRAGTTGPLNGLDPGFNDALSRMIAASGGRISIESGFRSDAQQATLFAAAVKKYGSESAARNWVAPPGQSNHNRGLAADLGGDIGLAHQLAPQFGLVFPMSWEPWHIEPVHARDSASPGAYTTPPKGEANPTDPTDPMRTSLPSVLAMVAHGLNTPTEEGQPTGDILAGNVPQAPQAAAQQGAGQQSTTPQVYGHGSVQSSADRTRWATDFLTALGKPTTPENIKALTAWQQAESGGGGGRFNPLNTTQGGYAGESNLNSVGVKNFANYADGIAANVKVINNGRYQPILDALNSGNDAHAVARAIAQTPWGTGPLVERILGAQ